MSDKCTHNNHGHFLLWLFVWCLTFSNCSSCADCSGEQAQNKHRMSGMSKDILILQEENSLLKGRVHDLENKIQAESNRNISIDNDLDYMKREMQKLRDSKPGAH